MSLRVVVRRRADIDTDRIADYIAIDSIDAGRRFLLAVRDEFKFLAKNPKVGRIRAPARPSLRGLRSWSIRGFENYLIFYIPTRSRVEIVRVLHGARDIRNIFGER
jgi:toxin ParE1/3/4